MYMYVNKRVELAQRGIALFFILCIIIIIYQNTPTVRACRISAKASQLKMYMQQIDYLFSVLSCLSL